MFKIDYEVLIGRINQLCVEKNITVNKMLLDAELSKSVVDNIKRFREPSTEKLARIADYFGVSVDYLLGKAAEKMPAEGELSLSDKEAILLERFRNSSPEMQDLTLAALEQRQAERREKKEQK